MPYPVPSPAVCWSVPSLLLPPYLLRRVLLSPASPPACVVRAFASRRIGSLPLAQSRVGSAYGGSLGLSKEVGRRVEEYNVVRFYSRPRTALNEQAASARRVEASGSRSPALVPHPPGRCRPSSAGVMACYASSNVPTLGLTVLDFPARLLWRRLQIMD
ncbi:hypothetical protein C8R45DRAFT_1222704 [Mycena sanguinolenta]|nr:hypothetical protein C8R45DRAFT_1222704 [Mycena sanguinolenta]